MSPALSLSPSDSVPNVVRRINNAFRREDEKQHLAGRYDVDWFAPIVADAEAGFGGPLHAFELMKAMIEAGGPRGPLLGPIPAPQEGGGPRGGGGRPPAGGHREHPGRPLPPAPLAGS